MRVTPVVAVAAAALVITLAPLASAQRSEGALEAVPDAPGSMTTMATTGPPPYAPVRAPGQPVPPTPATLPPELEQYAEYQGQAQCSPEAKSGAAALASLLKATYGPSTIWIRRECGVGGQSEHKEGRALDWMLSMKVADQRAKVEAFLWWVMQPDAEGRPGAMARRLGIMYLGWNDRIWRAYRPQEGWGELKGCFTKPSADYDTYCHRDHLHISLGWDGAAGRTSYWDSTAETLGACPEPYGVAALGAPLARTVQPLTRTPLVRTRTGLGLDSGPCRLEADRWDGDGRALEVKVLGRAGVPTTGVAAVRLRLVALGVNAPTAVVASAAGSTTQTTWMVDGVAMPNSVRVAGPRVAGTAAEVIAPVSTTGTVVLTNLYGAVDVAVDVTGWVPRGTPIPGILTIPAFPAEPLAEGSRGSVVAVVQRILVARGMSIPSILSGATAYGTFDADTRAALTRFQAARPALGRADGVLDSATYAAVTALRPTVSLAKVLAKDPRSVRVVQGALNSVMLAGLAVDGLWGARTQTAYDAYRVQVLGLSGTNPPGPTSLAKLGQRAWFTVVA